MKHTGLCIISNSRESLSKMMMYSHNELIHISIHLSFTLPLAFSIESEGIGKKP